MNMLTLLLNYVLCGRHLEFMCRGKINVRDVIPVPRLVKIDLLFVKIAPQMKNSCSSGTDGGRFGKRCFLGLSPKNREGYRSSFLRSLSKVPQTTKKLNFHENGHEIPKNDQTIWPFRVKKKDDYKIISRTSEIEKWEYDFWKAREKVAFLSITVSFSISITFSISFSVSVFYLYCSFLSWKSCWFNYSRNYVKQKQTH